MERRKRLEPDPNDALRAAFYGIVLRSEGYAPDEAAAMVVRRYPGTRERLQELLQKKPLARAASAP